MLLEGLSYRRAARMVEISKTEVGDSLDLLLGELAALGCSGPRAGPMRVSVMLLRRTCKDFTDPPTCWSAASAGGSTDA